MKRICILIIALIFYSNTVFATNPLTPITDIITLDTCKDVYYVQNPTQSDVTSILRAAYTLTSYSKNTKLQRTNNIITFRIANNDSIPKVYYFDGASNDYVAIYVVKDDRILQQYRGGFIEDLKITQYYHHSALTSIEVAPYDTCTIFYSFSNYLSYHTKSYIVLIPQHKITQYMNRIYLNYEFNSFFNNFFAGAIIFAFFFVLFLFYYVQSKTYLLYALYLFTLALFSLPQLKNAGILSEVFHLRSTFYYYLHEPTLFLFCALYGLFAITVLDINKRNYPKIYYFVWTNSIIVIIYIIFLIINIHYFDFAYKESLYIISRVFVQTTSIIFLISLLFIKSPYKWIIFVGNALLYVLGILAFVLDDIFHLDLNFKGYDISYFFLLKLGLLFEILFFGMALGKRTYILEQERLNYYRNYIEELHTRNILNINLNKYKTEALRAQFNPHFIFNSLNSIHYLVLQQNTEKASQYIQKFAKLFRNILDFLRTETISLEDEISAISLYLDLERERLNDTFSYDIEVDSNIDISQIMLPSMLLQPFIENSIWHGLHNSTHLAKKIHIKIFKKNDALFISIYDNGIGRNSAKNFSGHSSVSNGINICEERIHLFNQTHSANISLQILDHPDDEEDNIGTKVILKILQNDTSGYN